MLTRLEAHNFKNLLRFSVDFGPFTCVAGPNAAGKSNIFDAIQFLARLADNTLMDAVLSIRGGQPETSDLTDIFWSDGSTVASEIRLAAEMIVDQNVTDDFGRAARASSTYLRYEVHLGYDPGRNTGEMPRIYLKHESLKQITEQQAVSRLGFRHSAKNFRKKVVRNARRSKSGFISTEQSPDGHTEILVHQDGGGRGQPQRAPASTAPSTIVATSNTSSTPTILAAKREMQRWLILALEPSAMRLSDRLHSPRLIDESGGHMAGTLYKLVMEEKNRGYDPSTLYVRLANRISSLVPIQSIQVDVDEARQSITLQAIERTGLTIPARSLSDGTLRFITLSLIAEDPDIKGLICMEEPENGIHPAKIGTMMELLQDLVFDPEEEIGTDNPMRQLIIATHSPGVVQLQDLDDLLFAQEVALPSSDQASSVSTIRCAPLSGSVRANRDSGSSIGKSSILAYLSSPPGAQITFDF